MNNILKPMKIGSRTAVIRIAINAMESSDALLNGDQSELTYKRYG